MKRKIGIFLFDLVVNGVQQVSFTQAGAAVDEQRVVKPRGFIGHRLRRRVGKAVRRADNEIFE